MSVRTVGNPASGDHTVLLPFTASVWNTPAAVAMYILLSFCGSNKAHRTGMSGRLPSMPVQEPPPSLLYQILFTPKLVNTATRYWSEDPILIQFKNPAGKEAPVITVVFD